MAYDYFWNRLGNDDRQIMMDAMDQYVRDSIDDRRQFLVTRQFFMCLTLLANAILIIHDVRSIVSVRRL